MYLSYRTYGTAARSRVGTYSARVGPRVLTSYGAVPCLAVPFLFQLHLLNTPVAIQNIVNLFRPFLKKKLFQKVNTIAEVAKPRLTLVRMSAVS